MLKGTTNQELNSEMLISKDVPLDWSEQEALFLGWIPCYNQLNSLIFFKPNSKTQLNIGVYPQLGRFQLSKNKKIPIKFPV